jgi:Tfp pilus assembly protein PilF
MSTLGQAFDLASDYFRKGDLAQAERLYRLVLQGNPRHLGALHGLGLIAFQMGKVDAAATYFHQVAFLDPGNAEAHYRLGNVLWMQGKLDEAVIHFRRAVSANPHYPSALINLGGVLLQQGKASDALPCLENALRLEPNDAETHHNLGAILVELGRFDEAAAAFREALRLNPCDAETHNTLANVLRQQGKPDEARASVQEALGLKPDLADAHNNLGNILSDQHRLTEAEAAYRAAVRCDPDNARAHLNLGTLLLCRGNFEQGWPEYEWRLRTPELAHVPIKQPRWDGGPLNGKVILLHAEQGLGDTVQFIRYAPLVKERGGRVVVVCPDLLTQLLARSPGVDRVVASGLPLPPFEVHAPLLSLPGLFRTTAATIPARVPYVFPEPSLVQRWREKLGDAPGYKVGIAWRGSTRHKKDRERSVSLETLAPLAAVPSVCLYSLQVESGREELTALAGRFAVTDLAGHFDPTSFADAAAVIPCLDLVVTVDSALAHLAGALGAPVWVALPFNPDWRWHLERQDSPWYPSMRLFRQKQRGQWPKVFETMAAELMKFGHRE